MLLYTANTKCFAKNFSIRPYLECSLILLGLPTNTGQYLLTNGAVTPHTIRVTIKVMIRASFESKYLI